MRSILFLMAVALSLLPAACAVADEDTRHTVEVSATARVTDDPDIVRVRFAVETISRTAEQANLENASRMSKVIGVLRESGVVENDLRTLNYHVTPRYDADERGRREIQPSGYAATNAIEIIVRDLSLVGARIDKAVAAGANRVESISFEIEDPSELRAQALGDAVANARTEATILATAAGRKIGKAVRIQSHGGRPVARLERAQMAMSRSFDVSTPIEPGPIHVDAQVTVLFELVD